MPTVSLYISFGRDNSVRVNLTWRVLRLRMEEMPPDKGVTANLMNKLFGQPTRGSPPT